MNKSVLSEKLSRFKGMQLALENFQPSLVSCPESDLGRIFRTYCELSHLTVLQRKIKDYLTPFFGLESQRFPYSLSL